VRARASPSAVLARAAVTTTTVASRPCIGAARRLLSTATSTASVTKASLLRRIGRWAEAHPFAFQVMIATSKTVVADALIQLVTGDGSIDWRRSAMYMTYGFLYLGCAQYAIYVTGFSRIWPGTKAFCSLPLRAKLKDRAGLKLLFQQVFFDLLFVCPVVLFPSYYFCKELIKQSTGGGDGGSGGGGEGMDLVKVFSAAMSQYGVNMKEDLAIMWTIWLPFNTVIFGRWCKSLRRRRRCLSLCSLL
jgi:hypothetical protein